jgi:enamine deaminase RidA (YjgF/YER057c/UK114 family)
MAGRRLISSGSPFETQIGYSRAVVAGPWVFMSGTTGVDCKSMTIADNVVDQAEQCFRNVGAVLEQAGVSFADVVRITYLLTPARGFRAHLAGAAALPRRDTPACTMMVTGLLDPRMLIEVEVTAFRP